MNTISFALFTCDFMIQFEKKKKWMNEVVIYNFTKRKQRLEVMCTCTYRFMLLFHFLNLWKLLCFCKRDIVLPTRFAKYSVGEIHLTHLLRTILCQQHENMNVQWRLFQHLCAYTLNKKAISFRLATTFFAYNTQKVGITRTPPMKNLHLMKQIFCLRGKVLSFTCEGFRRREATMVMKRKFILHEINDFRGIQSNIQFPY